MPKIFSIGYYDCWQSCVFSWCINLLTSALRMRLPIGQRVHSNDVPSDAAHQQGRTLLIEGPKLAGFMLVLNSVPSG